MESIAVGLWRKQDSGSCSGQNQHQLFRLSIIDPFYKSRIAKIESETVVNYLLRILSSQET